MEYSNNTPICRRNKHLNQFERSKIEVLSSLGYSPYRIAKMINRSANTVRNEIKRGTVTQIKAGKSTSLYFAETGHIIYTRNRRNCGSKFKLFKCQDFIEYVHKLFYENKHSFDSIVGSCKINGSLYTKVFKSFTADNGLEFSKLSILENSSALKVYFAHPYL